MFSVRMKIKEDSEVDEEVSWYSDSAPGSRRMRKRKSVDDLFLRRVYIMMIA